MPNQNDSKIELSIKFRSRFRNGQECSVYLTPTGDGWEGRIYAQAFKSDKYGQPIMQILKSAEGFECPPGSVGAFCQAWNDLRNNIPVKDVEINLEHFLNTGRGGYGST